MSVTDSLADFLINFKFKDIPSDVIRQSKRCILDSLGCAIGAYDTNLGKTLVHSTKELACSGRSTLIGDGSKLSPHQAAFANSSLANLLDFDDTAEGIGHPGSMVVPSALAVAEEQQLSGRDLLIAVVLSYEIATRVGYHMKPSPSRGRKIFPSPCWGTFSGITAASKLLDLDSNQIANAFGIGGDSAPLPMSTPHWERPLQWDKVGISFASHNGILAAYMAKMGVPGCQTIFDGDGFWLKSGSDTCDLDIITEGLGEEYNIMKISFKPYPSVAWFHSANDAVASIIEKENLRAEDLKEIRVGIAAMAASHPNRIPKTMGDCSFSLHYGIAMVVLREPPGPAWFIEEKMNSKEVIDLLKRIKVETDPEATNLFDSSKAAIQRATVSIITKAGKAYTEQVDNKRGSMTNPLTDSELENKFRVMAAPVIKNRADEIVRMIYNLEEVTDITSFTKAMKEC